MVSRDMFNAEEDDFFVEEPIHLDDQPYKLDFGGNSSDDEEDDDDVDTEASIHNLNFALTRNKRNQSYANFLSRSERNALLGKDPKPSPEEAKRRAVKFPDDTYLEVQHIIPRIDDDDKDAVWFNAKDFDRFDTETKITIFRWENHLKGKLHFDENQNSIRGLEHEIKRKANIKSKDKPEDDHVSKWKHIRDVLTEINRQKIEGATNRTLDWERIREVAQRISRHTITIALERGASDELERKRATGELDAEEGSRSGTKTGVPDKKVVDDNKKKQNPLRFFWQKKK